MRVEPYDFRKPGRTAGGVEQWLAGWLATFCALAPARWARHLPFAAELRTAVPETAWPDAALARLPDAAVGYRVEIGGVETPSFLVLPRRLALALVAGALGDPGTELPADRELTVVEESLLDYVAGHLFLDILRAAWPGGEPPAFALRQKEANPRYAKIFPPDGGVFLCECSVAAPFGEQPWFVVVPQQGWPGQASPSASAEGAAHSALEAAVRELPVPVVVVLGTAELPLSHTAGLGVGDLVLLAQRIDEPLGAFVGDVKKFRVWPGRVGTRQAVEIESVLG